MSITAPVWRCVSPDAIVWREWDGEFVIRNERSGSSHLLGTLAGSVLQVLLEADRALSVADIASCLGHEQSTVRDADLSIAIDQVLAEFRRLELAEALVP